MSNHIKTPDGLNVWNPLEHGIKGVGLMVLASEHNSAVAELQSSFEASQGRAADTIEQLQQQNADLVAVLTHIRRCIPLNGFAQIHYGSATFEQIDTALVKAGAA